MTAKETLYKIKAKHNIGNAWQVTEPIIIEAMEEFAREAVKNCAIFDVNYLGEQACQHSDKIDPKVCIYDCTDCPITNKRTL